MLRNVVIKRGTREQQLHAVVKEYDIRGMYLRKLYTLNFDTSKILFPCAVKIETHCFAIFIPSAFVDIIYVMYYHRQNK